MITFVLGVDDLADTRFAVSPVHEALLSLRVLQDPGLSALHLPWRRATLGRLGELDAGLLMSLVARRKTIPDFLTPNPAGFITGFAAELAVVRRTPAELVRRDLLLAHAPDPLPAALADAAGGSDEQVAALRDAVCDVLRRYWELALEPLWPQARLVLEADMTYRARRLAVGGARLLFADMHPNLRWHAGVLRIDKMISSHEVAAAGRGLLLMPSVFAHKPAPPVSPLEAPSLVYPCRGAATLWSPAPVATPRALTALLGAPRARLLVLLEEPLPTVELARRLTVTASAVSQHLQVLHAAGLVTRARDGRQVLYRRSPLGDQLVPGEPRAAATTAEQGEIVAGGAPLQRARPAHGRAGQTQHWERIMTTEKAILAGGCFWGVQDLVRKLPGVISTRVGYSGGDVPNATYRNHGTHAEAIEIVFDPDRISYRDLLEFFFQIHDPTTKNRQGNDLGTSYRSAIFYLSDAQRQTAEDTIADVNASGLWPGKVVTEVTPAGPFWEAEPEHQDYLLNYPEGYTCHFVRPGWKLPRRADQVSS